MKERAKYKSEVMKNKANDTNSFMPLTVTVNLQYNGLFTNYVIFSPWNHDAIASTCFDVDIWK